MNYFNFEGARIAYGDIGSGVPVVLVHGALVAEPWGKFKPLLVRHFRVIDIHLPGFGKSGVCPGKVHDTDLFARAVCTMTTNLRINSAAVIGLSLGTVVIAKAAEKGCLTGKLILAGVPTHTKGLMLKLTAILPKLILRQIVKIAWVREKILMAALRINVGRHREERTWSHKFAAKVNETSPEAIADVDYLNCVKQLPGILSDVKNDKFFIYGEYDLQKKFARQLGLEVTSVKSAGHDVFSDQPEEMVKLVTKLLTGTP